MRGGDGGDGNLFNIDSELVIVKVTCTRAHTQAYSGGGGSLLLRCEDQGHEDMRLEVGKWSELS